MSNDISVALEEDGLTIGIYRKGIPRARRFFLGHKPQTQFAVAVSVAREIWKEGEGNSWKSDENKMTLSLYEDGHCTYSVNYLADGSTFILSEEPVRSYCRRTAALTLGMANYLCSLLSVSKWPTRATKPSLRDKVTGLHQTMSDHLSSCEEIGHTSDPTYQTLSWVSKALGEILEDS